MAGQVNTTGVISKNCSVALGPYLRVKHDGTNGLAVAGAADRELGTLDSRMIVSGVGASENAAVVTPNVPGTVKMVAGAAITQYATVYGAASGKIDDTPNGNPIGIALEAATADGDYIEVLRLPNLGKANRTVQAKTATYTVTTAESGTVFTNTGATGAIDFDLPAAVAGLEYIFVVDAAQKIQIDPNGTETISLPSTGVPGSAGKHIWADAKAESVHLFCAVAGNWAVLGYTGTWTAET